VPEDALANWREAVKRGAGLEAEWNKLFAGYKAAFPDLAAEFERTQAGKLKAGWEKSIPSFGTEAHGYAQRGPAGDERDLRQRAGTDWRGGGFDGFDEDDFQERRILPTIRQGAMCFSACASWACARR
jgi:hypothetical protein